MDLHKDDKRWKGLLLLSSLLVLMFTAFWMSMVKGHYKAISADYWFLSALLLLVFNVNCLWLWKKCVKQDRVRWPMLIGMLMLEMALLIYGIAWLSVKMNTMKYTRVSTTWHFAGVQNFYPIFWCIFPTVLWSVAVFLVYHYRMQLQGIIQMKLTLNKTTQAWRRAQLDPHLLKHLLVTVRAINYRNPELTAKACDILVSIMNFHVGANVVNNKIFFVEEWAQVLKWLKLLKLKYGDNLNFHHELEGEIEKVMVIPMTAMVLMENMAGKADLTNPLNEALISARFADGTLSIRSYNWIKQMKDVEGSGTGLGNLEDRLEASYPGSYSLKTSQMAGCFRVELVIFNLITRKG